jgi:DNA polymerase-1
VVTVLLDSDIVAYTFASAAQESYNFGDTGVYQHVQEFDSVVPKVEKWIDDLMHKLNALELIVCLSVPTSEGFRVKVLPSYKGNRTSAKPVLLQQVKDWLASVYPSFIRPGLEADDVMGILSTHPKLVKGTKVIVSEDKDMQQIPGLLFNPRKHKKPVRISEEQANFYHMYQTLIGDTTDGYKGCPGIGPVKANSILGCAESSLEDYWPWVVETYESKGLTEEDALVQARVARICRWTDYDYSNKRVKLWTPQ